MKIKANKIIKADLNIVLGDTSEIIKKDLRELFQTEFSIKQLTNGKCVIISFKSIENPNKTFDI